MIQSQSPKKRKSSLKLPQALGGGEGGGGGGVIGNESQNFVQYMSYLSDFMHRESSQVYQPYLSYFQNISQNNKRALMTFSVFVAQYNLQFFKSKLQNEFKEQQFWRQLRTPIFDQCGRATFFVAKIGNQNIPLYSPGTIMFASAVPRDCDLSVIFNDQHVNGMILGLKSSMFMARFLSQLAGEYQKLCVQNKKDINGEIITKYYEEALKNCLFRVAQEDADQHGRLVELMEFLIGIIDDKRRQNQEYYPLYTYFLLKDFRAAKLRSQGKINNESLTPSQRSVIRQIQVSSDEDEGQQNKSVMNRKKKNQFLQMRYLLMKPLTQNQLLQIIQHRDKVLLLGQKLGLFNGNQKIINFIDKYYKAVTNSREIVQNSCQEFFNHSLRSLTMVVKDSWQDFEQQMNKSLRNSSLDSLGHNSDKSKKSKVSSNSSSSKIKNEMNNFLQKKKFKIDDQDEGKEQIHSMHSRQQKNSKIQTSDTAQSQLSRSQLKKITSQRSLQSRILEEQTINRPGGGGTLISKSSEDQDQEDQQLKENPQDLKEQNIFMKINPDFQKIMEANVKVQDRNQQLSEIQSVISKDNPFRKKDKKLRSMAASSSKFKHSYKKQIQSQQEINAQYINMAVNQNAKLRQYLNIMWQSLSQVLVKGEITNSPAFDVFKSIKPTQFVYQMSLYFNTFGNALKKSKFKSKKLKIKQITTKIDMISKSINPDQSKFCAQLITKGLLLARRHYISKIGMSDIRTYHERYFKKLRAYFYPKKKVFRGCLSPQTILVQLDCCFIIGFLMLVDHDQFYFSQKSDYEKAVDLAQEVKRNFLGFQLGMTISDPRQPKAGEVPDLISRDTKNVLYEIDDSKQSEDQMEYSIPQEFYKMKYVSEAFRKKPSDRSNQEYMNRCIQELFKSSDGVFAKMMQLTDLDNKKLQFYNKIVTAAMKLRVNKGNKKKCTIF